MDAIRVVLPKQYDLVVGDTFQLFYRGVVEAPNPFCYDVVSTCVKGKNYPRYFEYTPEAEGQFELTISVYDACKNLLGGGTTTLCVTEAKEPEKPVSILCIGDSLTASGAWVLESARRLTGKGGEPEGNGFSNIRFIGTCEKTDSGYEGYGGWKWESYMSDVPGAIWIAAEGNDKTDEDQHSIWQDEAENQWKLETITGRLLKFLPNNQSEPAETIQGKLIHVMHAVHQADICFTDMEREKISPFYSEEAKGIDFQDYCRRNGFNGMNGVYILLGWNGLSENKLPIPEYCKSLAEKARVMVDAIHKAYPKAWIRILGLQIPSVNGGTGANYGASLPYCDDYGLTRYVMELNIAYETFCLEPEYSSFLEFINLSGQFDSDYNMPMAEKCVNTRNKKTEVVGTNGVHPAYEGYMQIADAVYRNAVKSIRK